MSLYKPGVNLPCMMLESGGLENEELAVVVASFSYEGLQMAAALGLSAATKSGMSPKEIDSLLNDMLSVSKPHLETQEASA